MRIKITRETKRRVSPLSALDPSHETLRTGTFAKRGDASVAPGNAFKILGTTADLSTHTSLVRSPNYILKFGPRWWIRAYNRPEAKIRLSFY